MFTSEEDIRRAAAEAARSASHAIHGRRAAPRLQIEETIEHAVLDAFGVEEADDRDARAGQPAIAGRIEPPGRPSDSPANEPTTIPRPRRQP